MKPFTSAIILAAGSSSRMESISDKLLIKLGDITVLEHVIKTFQTATTVDEIIIVTNKNKTEFISSLSGNFDKINKIIIGGNTRTDSALNGFRNVSDNCDFLCFHDCARPFITSKEIDRLNNIAYKKGNIICGKKSTDTIKIINNENIITETPERKYCICAQTPQIFKYSDYKNSLQSNKLSFNYTDDSQLLEQNDYDIMFVECNDFNEKITTDRDLLIFQIKK